MQVLGVSLDTLMSPEEEGEEEQEGEGEELETLSAVQSITATPTICLGKTRGGILGHQFDKKRHDFFAPCYSQSFLTENHSQLWF
jgi:hypothetical protein